MKRRKVLKMAGVSSAAALVASPVSAAKEAISDIDKEEKEEIDNALNSIEELSGWEEWAIVRRAKDTDEYKNLRKSMITDGIRHRITDTSAFEIVSMDVVIAEFEFRTVGGHSGAISIPVGDNDDDVTERVIIHETEDDELQRVTQFLTDSGITLQSNQSDLVQTASIEGHDVKKVTIEVNNSVRTMSQEDLSCTACKIIVSAANAAGCSASTAVICAVATAKTAVGPIVCAIAVGVICAISYQYGINNPERVCSMRDMWGNKIAPTEGPCGG